MRWPSRRRVRRVAWKAGAVVCALLVVAWALSGWVGFGIRRTPPRVFFALYISNGCLVGTVIEPITAGPGTTRLELVSGVLSNRGSRWQWWFEFHSGNFNFLGMTTTPVVTAWSVPLWAPLLIAGGATLWPWWRDRRWRFGPGRCAGCGYELRGLGAGAVCPECGGVGEGPLARAPRRWRSGLR